MSETLKQLVDIGTFVVLQEKLEVWLDNFKLNSCDQNVAIGCEIIELNAKIQGHLFKLLSLCASEGGKYGGAGVIKSRLLPILSKGYSSDIGSQSPTELIKPLSKSKNNYKECKGNYQKPVDTFHDYRTDEETENEGLRLKLEETKMELDRQSRQSSNEKMFDKEEMQQLRRQLTDVQSENDVLKSKARLTDSYQQEVSLLKDDVALLSAHRGLHGLHTSRAISSCDTCRSMYDPCRHHGCPIDSCHMHLNHCDPLNFAKEQHLVSKFNDLFSVCRTDAMSTLANFSDDHDNNQKIIFNAITESFNTSKTAFRQYKSKIRADLIGHHSGCSLEESVQHYINNHAEHEVEVADLCHDVITALNFKVPLIRRPPGFNFEKIGSFLRDACAVAWSMSSLPIPIDVYHPASDGELFEESRYRRSYDSDYNAVFVSHHMWPCLVKNGLVIAKGEVVTKKAGSGRAGASKAEVNSVRPMSHLSSSSSMSNFASLTPKSFRSLSPSNKRRY